MPSQHPLCYHSPRGIRVRRKRNRYRLGDRNTPEWSEEHARPSCQCSQRPWALPGSSQSLHLSWENPEHFQPSPIHICVYYFFCPPDWQWATLFVYFLKESTVCLSVSYRCQCLICLGWQENKWTYYATFKSPSHPSLCSSPFCCPSRPAAHTDLCPCLDLLWCSEGIF